MLRVLTIIIRLLISLNILLMLGCETKPYSDKTYKVGGVIIGLTDEGLVVSNQKGERLDLLGNQFRFTTELREGEAYSVSVVKQPQTQVCKVYYGIGVVKDRSIDDIEIRCRSWKLEALFFQDSAGDASDLKFAQDSSNHAAAVWESKTNDSAVSDIFVNLYSHSSGVWFAGKKLNIESIGRSFNPQLAAKGDRNLVVVWQGESDSHQTIYVTEYTNTLGWVLPVSLPSVTNLNDATNPQVVMSELGQVMVVWQQSDGTAERIWSSVRDSQSGWGWAVPKRVNLGTDDSDAREVSIAMDTNGDVAAVWLQENESGLYDVWSNTYSAKSGQWSAQSVSIESNDSDATPPRVTVDGNNNILAAWTQESEVADNRSLWVNIFNMGDNQDLGESKQSWGEAVELVVDQAGDATGDIQVMAYRSTQVIVVWIQSDGSEADTDRIWAATHSPEGPWTGGELPVIDGDSSDPALDAESLHIAQDDDGNVLLVWKQAFASHSDIWAKIYTPISGWGRSIPIERIDSLNSSEQPAIAMGPNGQAIAVWRKGGDLFFNLFE